MNVRALRLKKRGKINMPAPWSAEPPGKGENAEAVTLIAKPVNCG